MQLRQMLGTELDPCVGVDATWNDNAWDDIAFDGDSIPGSEEEIEAAERWLESHPLDDEIWH